MSEVKKVKKEVGTKEVMEMVAAIKVINTFVAAVLEDHKLTQADFIHVINLSAQYQVLEDGYKGKELMMGELKDLTKAELVVVIADLYDAFSVFTKAKTLTKFR